MKKDIQFQQHIRTSSKARRGFRTYQQSQLLDDSADEKLSSYGVYIPSAYPDISVLQPEDFPELFTFYSLNNNTKVLCKSVYIGLDLHSYPPRSGNYLAHTLIYKGDKYFNPLEIYEKARWKTAREVADEDQCGGGAEMIGQLSLTSDPAFFNADWFKGLIADQHPEEAESGTSREMEARQKMFLLAVDAIINKRQLIIIDRKEMLLKWTMTLLQSFPTAFVYAHISIASFANSNLLLDVCQVLCCESGYVDRLKRYITEAVVADIETLFNHSPSVYARSLLKSITEGKYAAFRETVFTAISESAKYSADEFDRHSMFFEQLYQLGEMPQEAFRLFFSKFLYHPKYSKAIFDEVERNYLADFCPIIWDEMRKIKVITSKDLSQYQEIAKYTIPRLTDESWMSFEKNIAEQLKFESPEEVAAFFNTTDLFYKERDILYFDILLPVVKKSQDFEVIEKAFGVLKERINEPDEYRQHELNKMQHFIDAVNKTDNAGLINKYAYLIDVRQHIDEVYFAKLIYILKPIKWDDFFSLLENKHDLLVQIFEIEELKPKLPKNEICRCIIEELYLSNPKEFYSQYTQLPQTSQHEFMDSAPKKIKDNLLSGIEIDSLETLESTFALFPHHPVDLIMHKFIDNARLRADYNELWKLCSIVLGAGGAGSRYQNIIEKLDGRNIKPIYQVLDFDAQPIPEKYIRLADIMKKRNLLTKSIPKSELQITAELLGAIGQIQDIETVRDILCDCTFDYTVLLQLIKLPWLYFAWEQLFGILTNDQRNQLPKILCQLLEYVEIRSGYVRETGLRDTYTVSQWRSIICQYVVFLLMTNEKMQLANLLNCISITWDEYDHIIKMLDVALTKPTSAYAVFINPSNAKKDGIWFRRQSIGPKWL